MRTFQQWKDLVAASLHLVKGQEQYWNEVAAMCYYEDQNGGNVAVWHIAAIIGGRVCNCTRCRFGTIRQFNRGTGEAVFA